MPKPDEEAGDLEEERTRESLFKLLRETLSVHERKRRPSVNHIISMLKKAMDGEPYQSDFVDGMSFGMSFMIYLALNLYRKKGAEQAIRTIAKVVATDFVHLPDPDLARWCLADIPDGDAQ